MCERVSIASSNPIFSSYILISFIFHGDSCISHSESTKHNTCNLPQQISPEKSFSAIVLVYVLRFWICYYSDNLGDGFACPMVVVFHIP